MKLLMDIHFSFLCRSNRTNKSGESPIVLRVIHRNERRDMYTGLYCKKKHWDSVAETVRPVNPRAETINKNLQLIVYKAQQTFDAMKFSGHIFTIGELAKSIKGKDEKPELLIDYLKARNKELKHK